ncbi:MAG: hypothetical protein R2766_02120 [Saprospiraceae bacterium]
MKRLFSWIIVVISMLISLKSIAQDTTPKLKSNTSGFFTPSDTFNRARFNKALVFSAATYTGFSIGLYNAWYNQYPQSAFHLFDDQGSGIKMDKIGHVYTAYIQGVLCFKVQKWIGMSDKNAIWTDYHLRQPIPINHRSDGRLQPKMGVFIR